MFAKELEQVAIQVCLSGFLGNDHCSILDHLQCSVDNQAEHGTLSAKNGQAANHCRSMRQFFAADILWSGSGRRQLVDAVRRRLHHDQPCHDTILEQGNRSISQKGL